MGDNKERYNWFKNGVRKRRYWLILFLGILFLVSRMEFIKFRYDPAALAQLVQDKTGINPFFETRTVEERNIHFIKVGDRESLPLVIFVHGSPGALNAYELYFTDPNLLNHMDMIAVDRPGFGYSDFGKTEYSLEMQAALVESIAKEYPNRRKILVGHSMGGPIIAKFAMKYPDLVDGLLMVAPSISPQLEPSNTWRKILNFPRIRWFTPPSLRVCNQEIIPLKTELAAMMPDWKNILIPLTVIQGEEDVLVPKGNATFAKEMVGNPEAVKLLMLPGRDHFILWSELELVKGELLELVGGE